MFSFTRNSQLVTVQKYLRRVMDLTTPNRGATAQPFRAEDRHNRAIPTLLAAWEGNRVDRGRWAIVLTRDISDRGIGLIARRPFPESELVLGYWLSVDDAHEPWFFRGTILRKNAIGGGFWALGVEPVEFMNERRRHEIEPLFPLAHKLVPPLSEISDRECMVADPSAV